MNRRNGFRSFLKVAFLLLLVLVVPLGGGYFLSLCLVPTPQVAVIRIETDIWGGYTTYLSEALAEAATDRAIRAVVLDIASPGGEVTATENLYYDILKLRETMPVLASIDEIAASGAYYVACAADQIYAKPASEVGNIGVISILPPDDLVDEMLITTGPFKLSGGPQEAYVRKLDVLKDTFLAAIFAQRGDRLQVEPEVLSRGEIYAGLQAQQMGLIDEIGSLRDAVVTAADLAQLRHYEVVDRTPELPEEELYFGFNFDEYATAATIAAAPKHLPPGFYYRYVRPPH